MRLLTFIAVFVALAVSANAQVPAPAGGLVDSIVGEVVGIVDSVVGEVGGFVAGGP
ncbi:hypothetical protein K503DRAFT_774466 [Rhizopogon vinicolor AM-OR11-026]|uniref:Uncharacterized protein n=1 Tax=Rhizopogon vinicolor AM-OR11-026 TaxID=1314800 RepID=A0A1B7MPH8_9AGAM|nr:hypothetical protein K503DRAFT_774466 [Rhizopogon vinicolor AM-OR11-026]